MDELFEEMKEFESADIALECLNLYNNIVGDIAGMALLKFFSSGGEFYDDTEESLVVSLGKILSVCNGVRDILNYEPDDEIE